MEGKQRRDWKAEGSARLSLVLLVLNVVMLVVAAARLFCPDGTLFAQREGGVNLEGICAAAEAALGVISSGEVPRLENAAALQGKVSENTHLGLPGEQAVVVITASSGESWEEMLRLPEGMTVRKVFLVEADPELPSGRM